jgi:signal transduction histidine kinase
VSDLLKQKMVMQKASQVPPNLSTNALVVAEVLALILAVLLFFNLFVSNDAVGRLYRLILIVVIAAVTLVIVESIRKNLQQRHKLERLTFQLEAAEHRLQALDEARADFITIVSHQLRTSPTTIKWYVAAILAGDYGELPADVRQALQKVMIANNTMITVVEDLLNASRIERGKIEFLFEPINIDDITQLTCDQLIPMATMKQLWLRYLRPQDPLPLVMADKEKVRQVINNLIDNAIKYTTNGGVTIRTFVEGDNVLFSVSDTGKGISAQWLPTLFEKYHRGHDAVSYASGLGLGLYVAKIIIAQHKGKIWAESAGDGKGATFTFSLPIGGNVEGITTLDVSGGGGI